MNKLGLLGAVFFCVTLTPSQSTLAAAINQVDYFSLSNTNLIDFESLPPANPFPLLTLYDGVIDLSGAMFAERFVGQTLTNTGGFGEVDVLSGIPSGSLSLQTGVANENLGLVLDSGGGSNGTNVLYGMGPANPAFFYFGTGAIAILLDTDWSEFGLQVVGGNSGAATFEFWARDGSLIDTIAQTNLGISNYFGFSRENGMQDMAGISIWNDDEAGIGYDNIIFSASSISSVPVPAAVWLFGSGLIGLAGIARRKKA